MAMNPQSRSEHMSIKRVLTLGAAWGMLAGPAIAQPAAVNTNQQTTGVNTATVTGGAVSSSPNAVGGGTTTTSTTSAATSSTTPAGNTTAAGSAAASTTGPGTGVTNRATVSIPGEPTTSATSAASNGAARSGMTPGTTSTRSGMAPGTTSTGTASSSTEILCPANESLIQSQIAGTDLSCAP